MLKHINAKQKVEVRRLGGNQVVAVKVHPLVCPRLAERKCLGRDFVSEELGLGGQPRLKLSQNLTGSATNLANRSRLKTMLFDHLENLLRLPG